MFSNKITSYSVTKNEFSHVNLYKEADIPEFKNITYKIVNVESHDGTLVPMTIIHNKNLTLDGNNSVLSYSYGAFGTTVGTTFKTQYLGFVALGGIMVYPHIRGGGAKGKKWHKDGMKENKPNSWKDLIACIEYLVNLSLIHI